MHHKIDNHPAGKRRCRAQALTRIRKPKPETPNPKPYKP